MDGNRNNIFTGTATQLLATIAGTLLAVSDGMNYGWTAPMIPYFESERSHIKATRTEIEWLETVLMLGSLFALPLTIFFVNKLGRKKSMMLASCISLIFWIVLGLGPSIVYLFVARFFFGMTGNMSFVAAPMYVAEIADHKIRGFLSSIIYLMMLIGFIIIYAIGPYLPFIVSPIVGGVIIIIGLLVFVFMPESPYYLLMHNRLDDAEKSLRFFRPGRDIKEELEDISKAVQRQKSERGRIQDVILVKSNRKAILIMTVLNMGQHICAISVILMNLHSILSAAGSIYMDSSIAGILFSVIMLIAAKLASFVVDKYGRKTLLIFSTVGSGICLLAIAIYFNLKLDGYNVDGASWIPIVSVMIYAAVFKAGLGIVPIVITAEIFSAKIKAMGMTFSCAMYVLGAVISILLYQFLSDSYGMHVPFYIFTFGSIFITLFIIFYIPETKGKTLEEIQLLLKGKRFIKSYQQQGKLLHDEM